MQDDLLEQVKGLNTATLSDALDLLGIEGVMTGIYRRSGIDRVAGFALTVKGQVGSLGSYGLQDFAIGPILDQVESHHFLVIDLGGVNVSTFGGLASLAVSRRGGAGVIIDGGCRDIDEIRATGLSVASRFVTPQSGKGRLKIISTDCAVVCGGIRVGPADLIVLDETGSVVLPSERISEILDVALNLDRADTRFQTCLRKGCSFSDTARRLEHL